MIQEYPWLRDTYQPLEKSIKAHANAHAFLIQGNSGIGRLALAKFLSNISLDLKKIKKLKSKMRLQFHLSRIKRR